MFIWIIYTYFLKILYNKVYYENLFLRKERKSQFPSVTNEHWVSLWWKMKIKKNYKGLTAYFDILGKELNIESDDILKNMLESIDGFKFIYKDQPFNTLVKEQQKNIKHILVTFEPEVHDELKFKIKAIYNFLVETNQHKSFSIDSIEIPMGDSTLIVYGIEILRKQLNDKTGFSPTIRSEWSNPILIEKILKTP